MSLSKELQIGKSGEHLVCSDLIAKGYNAFLSDQGLHFDIIIEHNGILKTMQVKTTTKLFSYKKSQNIYRFGMRTGHGGKGHGIRKAECDYYAFVALDIRTIAYLSKNEMISKNGNIKTCIDFKTKNKKYIGRVYTNGTIRTPEWGKYIQDYQEIKGV